VYSRSRELVLSKELTADDDQAPRAVVVRHGRPDDLPLLAELNRRLGATRHTPPFRRRLAERRPLLLGFAGDELVGYYWWLDAARAAEGFHLSRFGLTLGDDEVYGYELFVAPEHRGRIAVDFAAGVESELAALGYRRVFGFVDRSNRPARWLFTIRGYETISTSTTRALLGRVRLVGGRAYVTLGDGRLRPLGRGHAERTPTALRGGRSSRE
jgi:hypothetical protein